MSNSPLPPPPPPAGSESADISTQKKSPSGAGRAFRILSILCAVATALVLLAALGRYSAIQDLRTAGFSINRFDRLDSRDNLVNLTVGILVYLAIATFVLEIVWTFRMSSYLRRRGQPPRMPDGMAIGGFFIPLANWIIPFLFLLDFVGGLSRLNPGGSAPKRALVATWWWMRVAGTVLTFALMDLSLETAESADDLVTQEKLFIASILILGTSFVLSAITASRFNRAVDLQVSQVA